MTNAVAIGGLSVGLVVTLLTSLFKTINLSIRVKHTVAVVLSVIGGLVVTWAGLNGDYSLPNIVSAVSAVYASSQLFYNYLLNGTNLDQVLEAFNVFNRSSSSASSVSDVSAPTTGE
jgi:hypothetical protein